jgi:hypothetical protein
MLGLRENGRIRQSEIFRYDVTGLPPDDVGYVDLDGLKWRAHWNRSGKPLLINEGPYQTPEEALEAFAVGPMRPQP